MLKAFTTYFHENYELDDSDKIAVATSGGVDSMVLCHLLLALDISFVVLHCNFHLRGEDSDGDARLVKTFAEKNQLEFEQIDFQTREYAAENRVSIQMAARELRYDWFKKIRKEKNIDWIATAHHLDDDIETILINLGRGTGIRGMAGIPDKSNGFIRPLLGFTKEQIIAFAKDYAVKWREDDSNQEAEYLRNYLRLKVIPIWKNEVPDLEVGFLNSKNHITQSLQIQKDYLQLVKKEVWREGDFGVVIDLKKLQEFPNSSALLYELLFAYGFTEWDDVYNLMDSQSGKMVLSPTHRLIKDRDSFLLAEKKNKSNISSVLLIDSQQVKSLSAVLEKISAKAFKLEANHTIFVAEKKLRFPLQLRLWKPGDFFYPAGMTGKKKLSKYFKDQKYSILEKEAIWVLCSEDKIVWVVGHRMDRRFLTKDPGEVRIKISI